MPRASENEQRERDGTEIKLCRGRVLVLERAIDRYQRAREAGEMSNEQAAYEHLIRVKDER